MLVVERTGPSGIVARVTLNRPDVHNAFNATLIAELRTTFAALARQGPTELRAVVLAGTGPSFCAGADVAWMRAAMALDVPIDRLGRYEINVGQSGLPNGYLSKRQFIVPDTRPTDFWIRGGIYLDLRPPIGRPPVGSVYRDPFKGTEPVDVFLVFEVTETSPGAVLKIRDLVVE